MNSIEERNKPGSFAWLTHRFSVMELSGITFLASTAIRAAKGEDISDNMSGSIGTGMFALSLAAFVRSTEQLFLIDDRYYLGNHGTIYKHRHIGKSQELGDGIVVDPGDWVGVINLTRNIRIYDNLGMFDFSAILLRDFLKGMIQLGDDIENGEFPEEIIAITGVSHLVGTSISQRLGFIAQPPSLSQRVSGSLIGLLNMRLGADNISTLSNMRRKMRKTHVTWMSRQEIVDNRENFRDILRSS